MEAVAIAAETSPMTMGMAVVATLLVCFSSNYVDAKLKKTGFIASQTSQTSQTKLGSLFLSYLICSYLGHRDLHWTHVECSPHL